LLEQERKWGELATVYGNLSLLSLKESDSPSALDYAEKGLGFAKRLNQPAQLADAYHRLAKAKEAMGEAEKALRYSETAYAFYDQLNDEMGCAMTLYHQASLYEKKGDNESAIRCLERVVAIDEKYGLPKLSENKSRLEKLRAKLKRP